MEISLILGTWNSQGQILWVKTEVKKSNEKAFSLS